MALCNLGGDFVTIGVLQGAELVVVPRQQLSSIFA